MLYFLPGRYVPPGGFRGGMMKRTTSKFVLLSVAFVLIISSLFAQSEGPKMLLDPILVERTVRPGDIVKYILNIENEDDFNPLTLNVSIADITESNNGSYEIADPGTTPYSVSRWLKTNVSRIVVPPKSLREVEVTLNVPRGVSGGLYGAVVLTPVTGQIEEEDALGVSEFVFQMASFLEVVIAGTAIRQEAYTAGFDVGLSKDYLFLKGEVGDDALVFSSSVLNEGNVHIVASGTLQIKTLDNRTVARYPLGGGRGVILPGATVSLMTVMTRKLPPGDYIARAVVEYGQRRPLISEVNFAVKEEQVSVETAEYAELAKFLIEPSEIEISIKPGAFRSAVVQVTNRGEERIEIESKILPLVYNIYGEILPEDERGEGLDWIELSPSSFSLEVGRSRTVRISIRPPSDTIGAYYADLIFRSSSGDASVEGGVSLLILSGSDFTRKASLNLVSMQEIEGAINLDYILKNEGNIHMYATFEVALNRLFAQEILESGQILPARSQEIARMTIPRDEAPVLPGAERLLSIMMPAELEAGEYELLLRIDFEGEEPAVFRTKFNMGEGEEGENNE